MSSSANNPADAKTKAEISGSAAAPASRNAEQTPIACDSSHALARYANFCRVTGTPEELIIDFGLNSQPMGVPTEPIEITQRIVLNYYTAKRMAAALAMSLQRHEAAFGVLETDVRKRVLPAAQPMAQPVAQPAAQR